MSWTARILTLFPDMLPGPLGHSLAGKALAAGLWACEPVDLRGFADTAYGAIDDAVFGGGPGLVMRPDMAAAAVAAADLPGLARIYLTPRGTPLTQARVKALAAGPGVLLLCGRYEGVDQRAVEALELEEISVGDFVLSGGEPAAMVLIDACVRLLPGVLARPETLACESFEGDLLEYPQYTRPAVWCGRAVPAVLLSGHHENIARWRRAEAERVTRARRPDLWSRYLAARAAPVLT